MIKAISSYTKLRISVIALSTMRRMININLIFLEDGLHLVRDDCYCIVLVTRIR